MKTYLGKEICAFIDDWLIVFDGMFNYMVFNCSQASVMHRHAQKRMPHNKGLGGTKMVEYYCSFDNALDNLIRCSIQGSFYPFIHPWEVFTWVS